MSIIKRVMSLVLSGVLTAGLLAGCASSQAASSAVSSAVPAAPASSEAQAQKTQMKIAALKGPTGLGMVKLMSDSEAKSTSNEYTFTLASAPDEVVAKLSSGEVDVAAVPTNLAATLYNKTSGKIQLAALNTLGVLSVVTNGETVSSLQDLKGKTVYSSGQGAMPEYVLNYILKQNGLEVGKDVTVEYAAEHAELAAKVISGEAKIAVLPEPFVTQVTTKNKDVKVALNLTQEWDKAVQNKSVLTMGSLVVRKEFAEKNKEAFDAFLKEYKASAEYANSNVKDTAALSEKYDIMPAAVAEKAIPNCNIVYVDGADLKTKTPDFLKVLFDANPKSIGGKLPGEDFYYAQ